MEFSNTSDIISQLKKVREREHISIKQIMEMVNASGHCMSETTIRRVFADGSESEDSFSYDRTLKPIAEVLLENDSNSATQEKKDLLFAVLREKNSTIERQQEKIEMLQDQLDKMRDQLTTVRSTYDTRLAFLRDQIELKDRRMDEKDAIINRLMEKLL